MGRQVWHMRGGDGKVLLIRTHMIQYVHDFQR
jgi:hypothetical protein